MPDIVSHLTISNIKSGKCAGQCLSSDFWYLHGIHLFVSVTQCNVAGSTRIKVMNQANLYLIHVKAIDHIVLRGQGH